MKKGFTLIELMLVMAVLGGMAAFVFSTFPGVQRSGRDTRRRSDLKQFQTSLESFANNNNNLYPVRAATVTTASMCTVAVLGVTGCPIDPTGGNYSYISDAGGTVYVMWATLEKPAAPVTFWVACSNGKSGTVTTAPTTSTCPLP